MYLQLVNCGYFFIDEVLYLLLQNLDMFWKFIIVVEGDVVSFIVQIFQGLKGYKCDSDWIQVFKDKDQIKEKVNM